MGIGKGVVIPDTCISITNLFQNRVRIMFLIFHHDIRNLRVLDIDCSSSKSDDGCYFRAFEGLAEDVAARETCCSADYKLHFLRVENDNLV